MKRTTRLLMMSGALTCVIFAGAPVANVSSTQPLNLDGHPVSAAGVSSWPLVVGDEIGTSTAPATMLFQDGSRIRLAPQSRVKLRGSSAQPKVVLVAGNLDYRLTPGSAVSLANEEEPQDPPAPQGTQAPKSTGGPAVTAVHSSSYYFMMGAIGAGAAAGITGGIYAVVNGSSTAQQTLSSNQR